MPFPAGRSTRNRSRQKGEGQRRKVKRERPSYGTRQKRHWGHRDRRAFMTIRDRINDFYNRFLSLTGKPEEIARAMALGVFIGVTPTIPLHTALVMVSCLIFRQNITAAMLGATIISNPLTIPLLYLAAVRTRRPRVGPGRKSFRPGGLRCPLDPGDRLAHPLPADGGGRDPGRSLHRSNLLHHPSCRRHAEKPQCRAR